MTIYRDPPKNNSRRSVGNLDGTSYGMGGTDTVRIKAGTGDFQTVTPVVRDNSYVGGKPTGIPEIKMQNIGTGAGAFGRKEADGVTFSFRRLLGGDGVGITERGDTILITAATGSDQFIKLKDAPSSYVGGNGKVLVVDEANSRLVFQDLPETGNKIHFGPTPPATAEQGDGWWNTTDGTLFFYYQDQDSGQWVESGASSPEAIVQERLVYDYGAFFDGQPGSSETIYRWRAPRSHTLAKNFDGCLFTCGDKPSLDFACTVWVNGQQVGTWTINPAGAATMVSIGDGEVVIPANQEIKIVAPEQTDGTLADLVISFKGERY